MKIKNSVKLILLFYVPIPIKKRWDFLNSRTQKQNYIISIKDYMNSFYNLNVDLQISVKSSFKVYTGLASWLWMIYLRKSKVLYKFTLLTDYSSQSYTFSLITIALLIEFSCFNSCKILKASLSLFIEGKCFKNFYLYSHIQ